MVYTKWNIVSKCSRWIVVYHSYAPPINPPVSPPLFLTFHLFSSSAYGRLYEHYYFRFLFSPFLSLVLPFVDLGGFRPLALSISQSALSAVAHLLSSSFHPCAWCVGFLPSPLLRPPPRTVYRAVEYTLHSLDSFNFSLVLFISFFCLISSSLLQCFFHVWYCSCTTYHATEYSLRRPYWRVRVS